MAIENLADIIASIASSLMAAEYRRLEKTLLEIAQENRRARGEGLGTPLSFLYSGGCYAPAEEKFSSRLGNGRSPLHPVLEPMMQEYIQDKKVIDADIKMIQQNLFKLLYQCCNLQELRDVLPECIVALHPKLKAIPRHCSPLFLIRNDPRAMRQWEAIFPKIEFYSATHLMY
jgi:hypothetical protein